MPESRTHKTIAKRIAKKLRTNYNPLKGVDIINNKMAVEVKTPGSIKNGVRQLQGHKKHVYIAGTNQKAVQQALDYTKGTTVGVMDNQGKIIKRSKRKNR